MHCIWLSKLTSRYLYLQGLFERHKLLVATQLCMRILKQRGELSYEKFSYLLRGGQGVSVTNPVPEWLPQSCWQATLALKQIEEYQLLPEDLVSSSKRWREWMEAERPEDEPLPGPVGFGHSDPRATLSNFIWQPRLKTCYSAAASATALCYCCLFYR